MYLVSIENETSVTAAKIGTGGTPGATGLLDQ